MIRIVVFKLVLIICYFSEVHSLSNLHFRCANGKYIYDAWFCDGSVECNGDASRSDETYGCDRELCGSGKFKCTDGTCMNITVRCNNANECSDGSDESDCGDELDIEDCPSREGSFLCADESKCIDFKNTCDGYCNCLDCSDENEGCLQYDNYLCDKCSDTCYVTPNDTNVKYITPPSQNISLTACKSCRYAFSCKQKCLYIEPGKERCVCDENYEVNGYNTYGQETCRSKVPYENMIIYSTPNEVKLFNMTTNETITLLSDIDCTALAGAHDFVYQAVYRADDMTGTIIKTSISSNHSEEIIHTESKILSIAIDWITNNTYYSTSTSIMVCSKDGRTCARLRNCSNCRVKLHPKLGLMFWNENNILFQSHMDGSNEQNFTITRDRYYTTNNTRFLFDVDEAGDTIFCSYFLPAIKYFRLYSEQSMQEFLMYGALESTFFDLDIFENKIFFSVEDGNVIRHYALNENKAPVQVADNSTSSIKYIQAFNRLLQRTKIPNPCENATCSLCLIRPYTQFIGLNYECKCDNIHSKDDQFSCDDESHVRSASVPDATARKRDIYDVNNPPFTWGNFLWKIKTIIIIVAIVLVVGVFYGVRKFHFMKKFRIMSVNDN